MLRLSVTTPRWSRVFDSAHKRWPRLLIVVLAVIGLASVALHASAARATIAFGVLTAGVLAVDALVIPGDAIRRPQTAVFALIMATAGIVGLVAALAVALLAVVGEHIRRRPAPGDSTTWRWRVLSVSALLVASLVVAPWLILVQLLLLGWLGAVGLWLRDQWRHGARWAGGAGLMLVLWLLAMLTMSTWFQALPLESREVLQPGLPVLRVAIAFMTLDSVLVTLLGLNRAGRHGVSFWRVEFLPTFVRYNVLALAGALTTIMFVSAGILGLGLALSALILGLFVLRERVASRRQLVATVCALSSALDARDPYTKGHSDRVAGYAIATAQRLGWSGSRLDDLELAAHLHDIGKIGIPDALLFKAGRFTEPEYAQMQRHAELSASITRNVPELRQIAVIVQQHHERLDGSGYPDHLRGDAQHPSARILAVADVFDALTSNRAYRDALAKHDAFAIIESDEGRLFDPGVVGALREFLEGDAVEGVLQYGYCLTH